MHELLPTPRASDGTHGGPNSRGSAGDLALPAAVTGDRYGRYTAALDRWAAALGRAAPAPTEPGRTGRPRLAAPFVEWLMGLPAGWVTTTPGLTRGAQLTALGNGVIPQQAAAALTALLTDPPAALSAALNPTPTAATPARRGPLMNTPKVEIIDADEVFPWLVVRTTDEADARAAATEWIARDPYGYFTGDPKPAVGNLESGVWRWIPNRSDDAACTKWLVTAKPGRGAFHGFKVDLNWAPAGGM